MNFNPFDLEAAHIFKIYGGKIHEIEAMGFVPAALLEERLEPVRQVAADQQTGSAGSNTLA
jgi:hypothetical protein